jgi:hypothetical protein
MKMSDLRRRRGGAQRPKKTINSKHLDDYKIHNKRPLK